MNGRERRAKNSGGNVTPLTTPDQTGRLLLPALPKELCPVGNKGAGGFGGRSPLSIKEPIGC